MGLVVLVLVNMSSLVVCYMEIGLVVLEMTEKATISVQADQPYALTNSNLIMRFLIRPKAEGLIGKTVYLHMNISRALQTINTVIDHL